MNRLFSPLADMHLCPVHLFLCTNPKRVRRIYNRSSRTSPFEFGNSAVAVLRVIYWGKLALSLHQTINHSLTSCLSNSHSVNNKMEVYFDRQGVFLSLWIKCFHIKDTFGDALIEIWGRQRNQSGIDIYITCKILTSEITFFLSMEFPFNTKMGLCHMLVQ
jgi:hypothetical protein